MAHLLLVRGDCPHACPGSHSAVLKPCAYMRIMRHPTLNIGRYNNEGCHLGLRLPLQAFPESLELRPQSTGTFRLAFRPPRDGQYYSQVSRLVQQPHFSQHLIKPQCPLKSLPLMAMRRLLWVAEDAKQLCSLPWQLAGHGVNLVPALSHPSLLCFTLLQHAWPDLAHCSACRPCC